MKPFPAHSTSRRTFLRTSASLVLGHALIPRQAIGAAAEMQSRQADLILTGGRIVTVNRRFAICPAMAVQGNRILRVGTNEEVLSTRGAHTTIRELRGRMVLPGLIDSHVHPAAAMTEFDHAIPAMETIADVLDYIRQRVGVLDPGRWIQVRQVFITRLREQRYPTRAELDRVAPQHPVIFSTGPDASLNSLALRLSGIDKNFRVADGGPGYVERDPVSGEPSGILRSCTRYVKVQSSEKQPTESDFYDRTLALFKDYNSVGITGIGDRDADDDAIARYWRMEQRGDLTLRVAISHHIDTLGPLADIQDRIRAVARDPLTGDNAFVRIIGIKTYLDGGMLTGSAYMREPWGLSQIYAIADPKYRGVLFIPRERLVPIIQTAVESKLQFTAHTVGDGAVHALLEAYEMVNQHRPIRRTRPCISHSNFMSREAVAKLAPLGVCVDIQPAWLYLDTRTLLAQFGDDRLRYFQPLQSIFAAGGLAGGGSDHMQKIGSWRSINPYNPFLGMWITITRQARGHEGALHPEEALSREQAIRFYTANNAYLLFQDRYAGSLEPGKRADFIELDTDLLNCSMDAIKSTRVLRTYLDGRLVFES